MTRTYQCSPTCTRVIVALNKLRSLHPECKAKKRNAERGLSYVSRRAA